MTLRKDLVENEDSKENNPFIVWKISDYLDWIFMTTSKAMKKAFFISDILLSAVLKQRLGK